MDTKEDYKSTIWITRDVSKNIGIKLLTEFPSLKTKEDYILYLMNLSENLSRLEFTLKRDENIIKVNGINLFDKLKDGWSIKSVNWEKVIKSKDGEQQPNQEGKI